MASFEIIREYFPVLMKALPTTFYMLFVSVVTALFLGLLLLCMRLKKNIFLNAVSGVYVSFMRGTPMMVQLLIIFIFVPMLFRELGMSTGGVDNTLYAIIAFSMNMGAFFCEIFRSAYLSVDKGQIEAAKSLGMNGFQLFRRVLLPQAAASGLPNVTNMTIELMKNTSVAMAIGVYDVMGRGVQLAKNNYGVGQKEVFIEIAVIYWVIGLAFLFISNICTEKLNKGNANFRRRSIFRS